MDNAMRRLWDALDALNEEGGSTDKSLQDLASAIDRAAAETSFRKEAPANGGHDGGHRRGSAMMLTIAKAVRNIRAAEASAAAPSADQQEESSLLVESDASVGRLHAAVK